MRVSATHTSDGGRGGHIITRLPLTHPSTHRHTNTQDLSQKKVALRGTTKENMEEWCQLIDRLASIAAPMAAAPRGAK